MRLIFNRSLAAAADSGHGSLRPRRVRRVVDGRWLGYGFVAPGLALLSALIFGPLIYSTVLSLYSWSLTQLDSAKPFAGLHNYHKILSDSEFGTALKNTFVFVAGAVSVELVLGFLIALALYYINRGRRLANAIILLPMITTPVIVALIWSFLLDPQFGWVDAATHGLGYHYQIPWLGSGNLALPSLMLIDIWEWTPFVILVVHAGMLTIPEELLEAARVDGASGLQLVRRVMIPALTPLILLVLLFRTMDTYRLFDTVYVLTQGGPGLATETVGFYTYRTGFVYLNMGYALSLSLVMLAIVAAISVFYLRLLRRRS